MEGKLKLVRLENPLNDRFAYLIGETVVRPTAIISIPNKPAMMLIQAIRAGYVEQGDVLYVLNNGGLSTRNPAA